MTGENGTETKSKNTLTEIGDYMIGKTLGQGSFGEVKLGIHKVTKKKVALKMVEHHEKDVASGTADREQKILHLLSHPNIVGLFDVIIVPEKRTTYLVLEFVGGGELFDYIVAQQRIREPEAVKFFRQMISAVEYCHSNMVIHRDLKPENILLDENKNVKINDFGLSNFIKPGAFLTTLCGSPLYLAPEIISSKPYIGPEVDVWSLGVILFAMVCGYLPWDGDDKPEQLKNAVAARYTVPRHVSAACRDLLDRMLQVDPKKRAVVAEIRIHPWVCQGFNGPPPSCVPARPIVTQVDEDILSKLVALNFNPEEVKKNVLSYNFVSQDYVMYHLLADQKRREEVRKEEEKEKERKRREEEQARATPPPPAASEASAPSTSSLVRSAPAAVPEEAIRARRFSLMSNLPSSGSGALATPAAAAANGVSPLVDAPSRPRSNTTTETLVSLPLTSPQPPSSPQLLPPADRQRRHSLNITSTGSPKEPGSGSVEHRTKAPANPKEGFLAKIFGRGAGATGTTTGAAPTPVSVQVAPANNASEIKPPPMKGAFNAHTVTSKPVNEIQEQVQKALEKLHIEYEIGKKGFGYKCKAEAVRFSIKICAIEKFADMKGLKFKRTQGDLWEFQRIHGAVIGLLNL